MASKALCRQLISPDAPEQPRASDLIRRRQDIRRNGRQRNEAAPQLEAKSRTLAQRREQLEAELARLTEEQAALTTDLYAARKSTEDLQDESTAELEASIQSIEETNRKVRANLEKARAEDEAKHYAEEYDRLTEAIAQKRKERLALLNGADLPLPELSVEDGALTYKGKRWRDMSGSDQLRVAAAIVRRLNPDCGFVLLDKLEQMDMTTLEEFGRGAGGRSTGHRHPRLLAVPNHSGRHGKMLTACHRQPQTKTGRKDSVSSIPSPQHSEHRSGRTVRPEDVGRAHLPLFRITFPSLPRAA
ncbi:MAG: hypothetical protein ACLUIR_04480 [Faecalibacterium prausnitzii]